MLIVLNAGTYYSQLNHLKANRYKVTIPPLRRYNMKSVFFESSTLLPILSYNRIPNLSVYLQLKCHAMANTSTYNSAPSTLQETPIWGSERRSSSTGKERDEETGYGYFGARYMDHELMTMWLSVDPMADKYPSISPYAYCAWNPVKLVDPDGNEAWKPDSEGNLIAEKGDNAATLARFCNTTVENAQKMLSEQGLPSNGEVAEGSKLTMDNVFTRSIQAANEGEIACLTNEQFKEQTMGMDNDQYEQWLNNWFSDVSDKYNCWGSAITGSQGNEIVGGCGIGEAKDFVKSLREGFSPVGQNDAVFGKTVISFSRGGAIQHGAVYYGTDNNGVVYVYTKNGWFAPPTVAPLSDVKSTYGRVSGYHNPSIDL